MAFNYDDVYTFDLTGTVSFGLFDEQFVYELFKDGRVASKFLEHHLPLWFPELEFVDARGYDHVHLDDGRQFDLKGFTMRGASYAPSAMKGTNRKLDIAEAHAHAKAIDYVFSDISSFPVVRITFKRGVDMIKQFPSTKITYKQKDQLFS